MMMILNLNIPKMLYLKRYKNLYDNSYKLTNETVVYSPAIRSDHPEMERARKRV